MLVTAEPSGVLRKGWRFAYARHRSIQAHRLNRRLLRLYVGFVGANDLVFDIGANIGARSSLFLALGARVVAVEPQPGCAAELRARLGRERRFTLFEGACAGEAGERMLFVSDAHTLSSMSEAWIDAVRSSGRFADYRWDQSQRVRTTTLDLLIEEHGVPAFVKIDVEGFEYPVLAGLSRSVPCLSIEWASENLAATERCLRRLESLGMSEFNVSLEDSASWALSSWTNADEVTGFLRTKAGSFLAWGDVYARRTGTP